MSNERNAANRNEPRIDLFLLATNDDRDLNRSLQSLFDDFSRDPMSHFLKQLLRRLPEYMPQD